MHRAGIMCVKQNMRVMYNRDYTPERTSELKEGENWDRLLADNDI